jgi:multiple sugar transport system ATP-binding protein
MTFGDRVCVLRDGILQQVDTPQNLFGRPVNLFVAGFIGSPSMNIVTATLVSDGDGDAATFAGYRLPILAEVMQDNPELKAYFGRDVLLGIRPSDFEDATLVDESWTPMAVTAHATEALGDEIHVVFALDAPAVQHQDLVDLVPQEEDEDAAVALDEGKSMWVARVNARTQVRPGDRLEVGVDTRNLHFFDPATGLAIRGQATQPVLLKSSAPALEGTAAP